MVMRADVTAASLDASLAPDDPRPRLLMSPRGTPLRQAFVRELVAGSGVVIVCGRFEGIDERVIEARGLEEVSIGDFVLSGGEMGAFVLLDACVRLLPGVMGADASGQDESFENGLLEYPHYTRPREFEGRGIPDVLLGGDHDKIAAWRLAQSKRITRERRPDLLNELPSLNALTARASPMRPALQHETATMDLRDAPPFTIPFALDETGPGWLSIRHRSEGHWWRFAVAEKNGRRQLVHDQHRAGGAGDAIEHFALDAYDFATLEARRMGWVD